MVPQPENGFAKEYADEAAVVERDELVNRYAADGTGVRTETTVLRVQSSGALQTFAVLRFPYATGTQSLEIAYARVRKPDGTVVETPAGDAAERVYRWKGAQLRTSNAKDEDDTPQNKTPPIAWTTFPSWEAVGAWYQALIAGQDAVTPALQANADEVTAGAKTDAEKVRRLHEYVSQHNHYIGVDFGVFAYAENLNAMAKPLCVFKTGVAKD